ncbi:MAG: hydantoinase/oxoprolinase family protein [Sphingomonadales bacterium]
MRIGIDVGGTNTDAVLMDGRNVLASAKRPTTDPVELGIVEALRAVTTDGVPLSAIRAVMIGTTHFTNAFVEARGLMPVGVIRLASPSGEALPPFTGWPKLLRQATDGGSFLLPGGYEFDGRIIAPFDEVAVRKAARKLRADGVDGVAITSVFAPIKGEMEERAAAIVREEHPEARITLSCSIGRIGFLERENATIMNAALGVMADSVMQSFRDALSKLQINAPLFVSQNDGTLMTSDYAQMLPVLTFGSGPTNSIRGAAFLSGAQDAIIIDVGGTTSDIGVLVNGFPRESSIAVNIGGVRTNFRMPDILAIGLGGGTRVHLDPTLYGADHIDEAALSLGPESVGYRLLSEGCLFGGETLTMSDVAVATGRVSFGDPDAIPDLGPHVLEAINGRARRILEDGIDRMKTSAGDVPVIVVGGGAFLVTDALRGASSVSRPDQGAVANAIGAAIGQVSGEADRVFSYARVGRSRALDEIRASVTARAIAAGAGPETVEVVDVEEVALNYLPGEAFRVRARAVGDLTFS